MTDSFDDAMTFARKISDCEFGEHPNESVREWCEMSDYDGTCVACLSRLLDRLQRAHESDIAILQNEHERRIIELQRAHEREMETVRDPQRIGGRHAPDSFAYAIEQLREFRWQHATNDDDAIPYINGVARAHEHEMEHLRKERFRECYEAGRRSMDAEHYQLKLKLQGLRFEGGSHENLSKIAYAIYPCATGWTCESCEGLRDRLIHLLGGVHDGTCPNADRTCPNAVQGASITDDGSDHEPAQGGESGAADCARGDCRDGESGRVDKRDSQKAPILANSDGENGGKVTITDELRKFKGHINGGLTPEMVLALRAEINYIADRIDEQEHKLRKQRDGFKRGMVAAQDLLEKRTDERDELQDKLDSMVEEYCAMRTALEISSSAMKDVIAERNELREKLDAILRILDGGD